MRIALGVEYDGTDYVGWQRQKSGVGVQARLESAIAKVADHDVDVVCAGRTDAGVHALNQVVHFDTDATRSAHGWVLGVNSHLPADVNVTWAIPVGDEFHARFTATSRRYLYLIHNRVVRSSLSRRRAWWVHESLDIVRMQAGADRLTGKHDFSSFRAAGCQANTAVREISRLAIDRRDDWVSVVVTANAFLQHMVRNIVGALVEVGRGQHDAQWIASVLAQEDRTQAGIAAPAHGLTLVTATYPPDFDIPQPSLADEQAAAV